VPAFVVHAIAQRRKSLRTPRLFALGGKGIAAVAAVQVLLVLVLSKVGWVLMVMLIFGGLMGVDLGDS
jgi:hypothetical protein